MNKKFKTEQEAFWAGQFGNEYVSRNADDGILAGNLALFSKIFSHTIPLTSFMEFGANIGMNLRAVRQLMPQAQLAAIEINDMAVRKLKRIGKTKIYHQSILDFDSKECWDFVLIKGVLIHQNPKYLTAIYDKLYNASDRYICIAEYYNPEPVEVPYRGHKNRLFKRDFAGDVLDRFKDLCLTAYGFTYIRDPKYSYDSINWFLLEKSK